jgi:hypothetical protein
MLPARATFAYDAVPAVSAAVLRVEASRILKMVNSTTAAIIDQGEELTKRRQAFAS